MNHTAVIRIALFLSSSSLPLMSSAYEVDTHQLISAKALSASELVKNPQKMKQLGLLPVDTQASIQGFLNSRNLPQTVSGLITEGAVFEDLPAWRVSNHFFNPRNNQPLTTLTFSLGSTSPDWATIGTGRIGALKNEFAYNKARGYFYNALTAASKTERDKNFGLTFESIGHVMHHLQDMAQPQHVRSDQHLELAPRGTNSSIHVNFQAFMAWKPHQC